MRAPATDASGWRRSFRRLLGLGPIGLPERLFSHFRHEGAMLGALLLGNQVNGGQLGALLRPARDIHRVAAVALG